MKKILKLAAVVCAAVLFVSCGAKDDATQIKEVMETYLSASASFDYAKLKTIVTPESAAQIDGMEKMMKDLPEEYKAMAEEAAKAITFNAESISVNGEVASVSLSSMGMDVPFTLKKVDGKWLIDMAGSVPAVDESDIDFDEDVDADTEEEVVEEEEEVVVE